MSFTLHSQATYMFKHALIQDTAYESLLRSTRQQYHARIANVLEQQFPEITQTQPELLARHYTAAGFHAPAVGYWRQASQNAVQRSAYVESSHHLVNGLEVLKRQPETPERQQSELTLQVALGRSLMIARGYGNPEAGTAYDRARDLCQQMGEFALARTHLEHCLTLSHAHPANTGGHTRGAGDCPTTQQRPAEAARRKAWRGNARSGQVNCVACGLHRSSRPAAASAERRLTVSAIRRCLSRRGGGEEVEARQG